MAVFFFSFVIYHNSVHISNKRLKFHADFATTHKHSFRDSEKKEKLTTKYGFVLFGMYVCVCQRTLCWSHEYLLQVFLQ